MDTMQKYSVNPNECMFSLWWMMEFYYTENEEFRTHFETYFSRNKIEPTKHLELSKRKNDMLQYIWTGKMYICRWY